MSGLAGFAAALGTAVQRRDGQALAELLRLSRVQDASLLRAPLPQSHQQLQQQWQHVCCRAAFARLPLVE